MEVVFVPPSAAISAGPLRARACSPVVRVAVCATSYVEHAALIRQSNISGMTGRPSDVRRAGQ